MAVVDTGLGWRRLIGVASHDAADLVAALSSDTPKVGDAVADPIPSDFGSPIVRPGKIIGVGRNYSDHVRESGAAAPERPRLFAKFPSSINGPFDPIVIDPDLTEQADYEGELAVVIGRVARRVASANALDYVFGYLVANDVSARDWQKRDGQVTRSKSMDTFCPLGPWITTAGSIADANGLWIRTWVNGDLRQDSTTNKMLFSIQELIEYCSRTMTLEPGDVILTGTPGGVGMALAPPSFLKSGDIVKCEVEGLGFIQNDIRHSKVPR